MWLVLDVVKHEYHPPTHSVWTGRLRICKFPFVTAKTTDYNYYKQKIIAWEKHYTVTLNWIIRWLERSSWRLEVHFSLTPFSTCIDYALDIMNAETIFQSLLSAVEFSIIARVPASPPAHSSSHCRNRSIIWLAMEMMVNKIYCFELVSLQTEKRYKTYCKCVLYNI